MKNEKILAIIPAFNEKNKIGRVVSKLRNEKIVDEILVIDDGSNDTTSEESRLAGAKILRNEHKSGVGYSLYRGIQYALQEKYTIVCVLAGNDKDNPSEVEKLITPLMNNGYHFVQGSRYLKHGKFGKIPFYRIIATRYIHPIIFSFLAHKRITDSTNGFRAFRLEIVKNQRLNLDQKWLRNYELEPYFMLKIIKLGYKFKEVPVTKIYPDKKLGYTKMKPITGWWSILRPLFYLVLGIRS